jgi:hypothetical protein
MRALIVLLAVLAVAPLGCGDKSNGGPDMAMQKPDLSMDQPDMAVACVMNPTTNVELLNACTDAQAFDKVPFYPAGTPNGELPPLP